MAAAGGSLGDQNLPVDGRAQVRHMGDDSHQPVAASQIRQSVQCLVEGLLIQRAEALVHKHRIQPHAAGGALYSIRQPQRQR